MTNRLLRFFTVKCTKLVITPIRSIATCNTEPQTLQKKEGIDLCERKTCTKPGKVLGNYACAHKCFKCKISHHQQI